MPQFLIVSRDDDAVLHTAQTLTEARGYAEGCEQSTKIAMLVDMKKDQEFQYQIVVIDEPSGRVLMEGPVLDIDEIDQKFGYMRICIMPVNAGRPGVFRAR